MLHYWCQRSAAHAYRPELKTTQCVGVELTWDFLNSKRISWMRNYFPGPCSFCCLFRLRLGRVDRRCVNFETSFRPAADGDDADELCTDRSAAIGRPSELDSLLQAQRLGVSPAGASAGWRHTLRDGWTNRVTAGGLIDDTFISLSSISVRLRI